MKFEQECRFEEVFGKALTSEQKAGIAVIENRARRACVEAVDAQVAYILATSFWESALTFQPVREGLAKSDEEARAYVCKLYEDKRIRVNYAEPAANGQSFYGRGYVQLTWEKNYRAIGDHIMADSEVFYHNPDLVMRPELAAIIMCRGMLDGIFTEHKLCDHINRDRVDFLHARQTVNRMDRAEKIAEWADKFVYILGD